MQKFVRVLFVGALLCAPVLSHAQETPEVAPGLHLSGSTMVSALDTQAAPKLVAIHATEIKSNTHAGGNFARSMVYAGPKSGIEIEGLHGQATFQSGKVDFFVRLPNEDADTVRNRITLIHLKPLKETREVLQFSANIFGGSRKRQVDAVPITKTDVEGGNWVKVTAEKPLSPGEYGITMLPKDQMLFSDTVYDFTIVGSK